MANNREILLRETAHAYDDTAQKSRSKIARDVDLPPGVWLKVYRAPFESGCRVDCTECAKHFRPLKEQKLDSRMYADELSDKDIEAIAKSFTKNIFQDRTYIRQKLAVYGDIILNKWQKKTEKQRRTLLIEASPKMFVDKNPQAFVKCFYPGWASKRQFRTAFLLPYLTVDNISDDKTKFLSLLHFRAEHEPEEWVMFDSEQLGTGYAKGYLEVMFNPNCVVLHGSRYGDIVPWNRDSAHSWNIVGWPRAHLILEAQAKLLQFLRKMVENLLDGYTGNGGSTKWKKLTETGFKASGGQEFWSNYTRQAYSSPPALELVTLLRFAKDKFAAAEDELELLQTDPPYTLLQINRLRKLDFFKNVQKEFGNPWAHVAGELVSLATRRCHIWRWVTHELSFLHGLQQTYVNSIEGITGSKEYVSAMGSLQTLLLNLLAQQLEGLKMVLHSLESFQHLYEYVELQGGSRGVRTKFLPQHDGELLKLSKTEPLFWAVFQLTMEDPVHVVDVNQSFFLRFIDEHLTNNSFDRLDQQTHDYLEDVVALDTILSALRYSRPFVPPLDLQEAVQTQQRRTGEPATWLSCTKEPPPLSRQTLSQLGSTLKGFAEADWPKGKKDRHWLEKADRSRQKLAEFWTVLSRVTEDTLTKAGRTQQEIDYAVQIARYATKPEHIRKIEAERSSILQPKSMTTSAPTPTPAASTPCFHADSPSIESEIIRNANLIVEKAEKKVRGGQGRRAQSITTEFSSLQVEGQPATVVSDYERSPIEVGAAAYRIFRKMFAPDPLDKAELRWQQFVAAMADAGCSATQSGGASVTFKHRDFGSILFHKPHKKNPTIYPALLQALAWRLTNRFGWNAGTFVERDKGTV